MQSTGPVTPPSRKPLPSSVPPVTSPVAGPSSPSIPLPAPLPPRNSVPSEWKRTSGLLNVRDDLLMSLLTSEAVVDSRECEILSGEEVEELKNEHQVLKTRLASAQKKLKLETKLRDAALSLSKLGTAHSKLTKPIDDQLQVAESRLNVAQTELRRVSERASEVERKLLEHRAGVLGYSVAKMEKNAMPSEDLSGPCTTNRTSALSSVTTTSAASTARFDGAHLFAGHADAQFPKAPPTVADIVSLEDKLRSATEALSAANQNIAVLKAELEEAKEQKFAVTNVVTILIPLWGMIGIWTEKFGFHNVWEFWAYNVVFGLFQAPYYAFSQTMMAELSPPGFENMFFGLFGLSNRASSMVGPIVIQAIIDNTGNNWMGFPFLFAMCTGASMVIWFGVDVKKGRRDAVRWASEQRGHLD